MTLRDSMLPALNAIRSIPGALGLRPYSVAVVVRTFSGDELGEGTPTTTTTAITEANGQPPKVRLLSNEQLALAGYDKQTWRIGPITPDFFGGGTPIGLLNQRGIAGNAEPHVVLTGPDFPNGANMRVVRLDSDHGMHYTLDVQRVADGGEG